MDYDDKERDLLFIRNISFFWNPTLTEEDKIGRVEASLSSALEALTSMRDYEGKRGDLLPSRL